MRRRTVTYLAMLFVSALAGACTDDDSTETTLEPTPQARTLMEGALGTQAVQDFMIHLEMIVVDDETSESVLNQIVDRAREGAGETVNLAEGFVFTPVDTLNGRMVDGDGEVMSSLSVDFGLMAMTEDLARQVEDEVRAELAGSEDGEQIADLLFGAGFTRDGVLVEIVTASYDQAYVHAGFDDSSEMDLSFLSIPEGAEMMVFHLFGLTLPGDPETEAGMTPHQLFEYRWNQGLIQFLLDDNQNPDIVTGVAQLESPPPPQSENRTPTLVLAAGFTGPAILQLATDEAQQGDDSDGQTPSNQPSEEERAGEALREAWDNLRKYAMKEQAFRETMRKVFEAGEREGLELAGDFDRTALYRPAGTDDCVAVVQQGEANVAIFIGTGSNPLLTEDYVPPFPEWPQHCGPPEQVTPETFATRWGLYAAAFHCKEIRNMIFKRNNPATHEAGLSSSPCDPPRGSIGGVWGDVHMSTFDGFSYSNQAAGEFLVFDNGVATVQMRTEPWKESTLASVATAMAVQMGDSTVSMHEGGDTWVDGSLADLEAGVPVAVDDGSLLWTGSSWKLVWADGTEMDVLDVRPGIVGSMFYTIIPSQLPMIGMLGTPNGDHFDDLIIRGSDEVWRVLNIAGDEEEFYATFIDSWRISEDESLFHYEPGETTSGFHLEGFPSSPAAIGDLDPDERQLAEEGCRRAGITRQDILDACIFDVTITGDPSFIYAASFMAATLPDLVSPEPETSPDPTAPPPPPIDAEQFLVIGPVALDIGPEPPLENPDAFNRRSCTLSSDLDAFTAAITYQAPDQHVDVEIQYVAASAHPSGEDSLAVIVRLNTRERAWLITANPEMGRIDSLSFDGTNLIVTGAGYFKEDPGDSTIFPGSALPPGDTLSPFTLQFICGP